MKYLFLLLCLTSSFILSCPVEKPTLEGSHSTVLAESPFKKIRKDKKKLKRLKKRVLKNQEFKSE